ncbi:MAG: TolC family protein [Rhodospirillaceae bacterium]
MSADRKALMRAAMLAALVVAHLSPAGEAAAAAPEPLDQATRAGYAAAVAEVVKAQVLPAVMPEDEKRAAALVRSLLDQRKKSRSDVSGRLVQPLDRRQAAVRGLELNLDLAIGRQEPERVQTLLREVRAVFDPVLDLQLGYNRADSYDRSRIGLVKPRFVMQSFAPKAGGEAIFNDPLANGGTTLRRQNFCTIAPKTAGCPGEAATTQPIIRAIEWYYNTSTAPVNEPIVANAGRSALNNGHPLQQTNVSIGLSQQLPWGGSVQLTDNTVQQKIYYRPQAYWEDGQFSSSLTGALAMPLPFTKGFGPDNPINSSIRAQEIARQSADWVLKDLLNQTLRNVDLAYFEVVRQLEGLTAAVDRLKAVQKLKDRQDRILKQDPGLITRYQQAQLESEVTKAGLDIETQLQNYLAASVTLGGLIGDPDIRAGGPIYLPYSYGREMEAKQAITADQAFATAKTNRPDFFIARLDRDSADVSLRQAKNQALPDVQLGINVTSSENGSVFGYGNPGTSQLGLFQPDTLNHSYSLTYTRPWGNHAALAAVDIARLSVEDRDIAIQSTEISVKREITGSLADLQSARARVDSAKAQVKALRSASESLMRQLEAGLVGEDQVIQAARNLLAAELDLAGARIDARETETRLLYAEGVIANVLPGQTASSGLDRRRLDLLADAGHLKYFGPVKK